MGAGVEGEEGERMGELLIDSIPESLSQSLDGGDDLTDWSGRDTRGGSFLLVSTTTMWLEAGRESTMGLVV